MVARAQRRKRGQHGVSPRAVGAVAGIVCEWKHRGASANGKQQAGCAAGCCRARLPWRCCWPSPALLAGHARAHSSSGSGGGSSYLFACSSSCQLRSSSGGGGSSSGGSRRGRSLLGCKGLGIGARGCRCRRPHHRGARGGGGATRSSRDRGARGRWWRRAWVSQRLARCTPQQIPRTAGNRNLANKITRDLPLHISVAVAVGTRPRRRAPASGARRLVASHVTLNTLGGGGGQFLRSPGAIAPGPPGVKVAIPRVRRST